MPPRTTRDVIDLLDASFSAAAVGAALELGLFWMLDEQPQPASAVAGALGIPPGRCRYWLQLLVQAGLLEEGPAGFAPSRAAEATILRSLSRDSWAFLAMEARERFPVLVDFALAIRSDASAAASASAPPPGYVELMSRNPARARGFTRMLYELHRALAEELVSRIDATGVGRMMDLGGGSGVVSLALARRYSGLLAVVVDIAAVCDAGREIAAENGLDDRVTYHPADFLCDELPRPFDLVVMCDVGVYTDALFRRVGAILNPRGRLVIADDFGPGAGLAPHSRTHWALEKSMSDPEFRVPTAGDVEHLLATTGFRLRSRGTLEPVEDSETPGGDAMFLLEAERI
jgi:SAM-dependent methyltransferase